MVCVNACIIDESGVKEGIEPSKSTCHGGWRSRIFEICKAVNLFATNGFVVVNPSCIWPKSSKFNPYEQAFEHIHPWYKKSK